MNSCILKNNVGSLEVSLPDYTESHVQNNNLHSHCCGESKYLPYIKGANVLSLSNNQLMHSQYNIY